jgi:hypothetical protein
MFTNICRNIRFCRSSRIFQFQNHIFCQATYHTRSVCLIDLNPAYYGCSGVDTSRTAQSHGLFECQNLILLVIDASANRCIRKCDIKELGANDHAINSSSSWSLDTMVKSKLPPSMPQMPQVCMEMHACTPSTAPHYMTRTSSSTCGMWSLQSSYPTPLWPVPSSIFFF